MLPSHMLGTWTEIGVGLANHIWQSTLFMIGVAAMALLFRGNSAVVRYRLWLIASVKFLLPFSLFVGLGSLLEWNPVRLVTPSALPVVARQMSQPFVASPIAVSKLPAPTVTPVADHTLAFAFVSVWFIGAAAVLLVWSIRWLHIARIVRNADPLDASDELSGIRILTSSASLEPGVFGIFRPVLLLPEGVARNLPDVQLEPIIAHEMVHVRNRDNLAASLHTIVEAMFWFHPLVWWLGNRLVEERERACDEAVLQMGFEPVDYAEGILKVCKSYVLSPACMAGVSGSNLRNRIEVIMENRGTRRLTYGKKLLLTVAGAGGLIVPVFAGMMSAAESPIAAVREMQLPVIESTTSAALPVLSQAPAPEVRQTLLVPAVSAEPTTAVHAVTLPVIESATIAGLPILSQTTVRAPQAGQTANDPQKWLDDVSIIITDQEKKAFQQLTNDEQRQGFITNFWLARDPTPGTPANEFKDEYDRRVAYANEHFTTPSGIPGSKTDRGKMYILNGPPDEIVSHPSGGTFRAAGQGNNFVTANTFPFETWRYRAIAYEFVDRNKNGEYTLEYDHDPGTKEK